LPKIQLSLQAFLKKRGIVLDELYRRLLSLTAASSPEEKTDPIGRYNILMQSILDVARRQRLSAQRAE